MTDRGANPLASLEPTTRCAPAPYSGSLRVCSQFVPTQTDEPLVIERVPIDSVREHPENARDDASMDIVRESIDTHGQYVPILVQRSTGLIAKGNHTHRVLRERGHPFVDVVFRDMSDHRCRQIMLVDNHASDGAGYRNDALAALLQSLDGDLVGTGYRDDDLAQLLAALEDSPLDGVADQTTTTATPYTDDEIIEAAFAHFREHGFPYPSVPRFVALQQINALARTEPETLPTTLMAYHVADRFQPHRFGVKVDGKKTTLDQFNDDDMLRFTIRWSLEDQKKVTPTSLVSVLAIVRGAQLAAQFRPGFALSLYRRFTQPGATILDTSTGFGGRLTAFFASECDRYIGIDPEPRTCAGNRAMTAELCPVGKLVEIIESPAEDVPHERLAGVADFSFTSPPYFAKERYSDDPGQSWKRYTTPEVWRHGFLVPMLALQYAALKPGAYNVVNIADVEIKGKMIPLSDWTVDEAKRVGFDHVVTERMPLSRVPGRGEALGFGEPLLIFQKPS